VGILLSNSSRLIAVDSIFVPTDRSNGIGLIGTSHATIKNCVFANCSLALDENAKLEVNNSTIYQIYYDNDTELEIIYSDIRWFHQQHRWRSRWHNILKTPQPSVRLLNSKIGFSEIRVINSTNAEINGVIGYQEYWNNIEEWKLSESNLNLTLYESELQGILWVEAIFSDLNVSGGPNLWVFSSNSNVSLSDSMVYALGLYGNSSATIANSNLYQLGTTNTLSSTGELWRPINPSSVHQVLNISASRVEYLNLVGNTEIKCNELYVSSVGLGDSVSSLEGSVEGYSLDFVRTGSYVRWAFTQSYLVETVGEERVLPGVELNLVDSSGDVVWSGVSDENGCAEFNITFCSYYPLFEPYRYVTNYRDSWNLTGVFGGEVESATISMFETGSPIRLDYSKDVFTLPVNNRVLMYVCLGAITVLSLLKFRYSMDIEEGEMFREALI
jgi:hypothetical protein